jgi:hypothetical protein
MIARRLSPVVSFFATFPSKSPKWAFEHGRPKPRSVRARPSRLRLFCYSRELVAIETDTNLARLPRIPRGLPPMRQWLALSGVGIGDSRERSFQTLRRRTRGSGATAPSADDRFSRFPPVHRVEPEGRLRVRFDPFATPLENDRYLRKAEVQGLKKRGAQHVRIKGQAVELSPTDASASWDRRLASGFYPVAIFFSVWPSTRRRGQSCYRFFCARSRQRMERGSVGGDYTSRKGSSARSLPDCD